ncbi:MAG: hypothetical protein ACLSWI_06080 [Candidatus Gastranaerophilaceae bacterium]
MPSGLVETEACYGDLCHYQVMTSMMAKNYIYTIKEQLEVICAIGESFEEQKKQEQAQERVRQANKSIIVKQVTITNSKGEKISLQEDKNGDDYLVINGKRVKTIGKNLVTEKGVVYDPYPESSQLENVIATAQREDIYKTKKRSYEEIIYSSIDLCDLFKIVYKLRVEHGVSYEDAKKLMTFGVDNRHYKPTDLLFPSEKQAVKYQKNRDDMNKKLKSVNFPKM